MWRTQLSEVVEVQEDTSTLDGDQSIDVFEITLEVEIQHGLAFTFLCTDTLVVLYSICKLNAPFQICIKFDLLWQVSL